MATAAAAAAVCRGCSRYGGPWGRHGRHRRRIRRHASPRRARPRAECECAAQRPPACIAPSNPFSVLCIPTFEWNHPNCFYSKGAPALLGRAARPPPPRVCRTPALAAHPTARRLHIQAQPARAAAPPRPRGRGHSAPFKGLPAAGGGSKRHTARTLCAQPHLRGVTVTAPAFKCESRCLALKVVSIFHTAPLELAMRDRAQQSLQTGIANVGRSRRSARAQPMINDPWTILY